jgi:PAS domain S-box-containing protein
VGTADRVISNRTGRGAIAQAAELGLSALAGVVAGAQDGITVVDADRRFVYANPAACEMLGYPLEQLRGRDFLDSIPVREHPIMLARFSDQLHRSGGEAPVPFSCILRGPGGVEREIVYSQFAVERDGSPHGVAIFQDLTGPRAASRAAVVLAQTASQLVGSSSADEILADIARHTVAGTRAAACGMATVNDDHTLASAGGYGLPPAVHGDSRSALETAFSGIAGDDVIEAMTDGAIIVGEVPRKPVVLSNARSVWQANPVTRPFLAMLSALDWEAGVYVPLSWQNRVIGVFAVYLPSGLAGPSEAELAFYTALADQAAVAVINSRLNSQARQAATSLERARLAREMHDSVSQGLFSMTMHARTAQLSMVKAGVDESGPLGRSIAELAALTRGALAEMRALIFELRPAALAEEGLVAALGKQAAALSAREATMITMRGPEERLNLGGEVEEHLYRIASEALNNVVNHADADHVMVSVTDQPGGLHVAVSDDGAGFDQDHEHPGHLGLSTMAERAETIGAKLTITTAPGNGTIVAVVLPRDPLAQDKAGPVGGEHARTAALHSRDPAPRATPTPEVPRDRGEPDQVNASDPAIREAPEPAGLAGVADAATLGLSTLAGVLAGAQEGITIADANRRFVYANPAACQMLNCPLEQLRGRDILTILPARERNFALERFSERLGRSIGEAAPAFSGVLSHPDGTEREVVASTFAADVADGHHGVTIFRDVTGIRAAARAAVALAQAASQLVGAENISEIMAGLARHAVESTRALSCGITIVGEDHKLASAGAYGPGGPGYGEANPAWVALADVPVERVIEAMTLGRIVLGGVAGKPVVLPDARAVWEASPLTRPFAANLSPVDWQAGVFLPLSWQNRVFGFFAVFLAAGLAGPSETELAFYTALADQAAVAVTNVRLTSQARESATSLERARLARELHDSVSQALFSMTMHARAAQLSIVKAGLDESGPLGRSIAELAGLTRGALAEMRALIFELRPAALAEEGLVAALRKQAAALTAREETVITVTGPGKRLNIEAGVEEHLYRIASEALHNVVNHAGATHATVSVTDQAGRVRLKVRDDGSGFDQGREHPGHLGLSTMAERAETIGAQLTVTSAPGHGATVSVSLANDRRDEGKAAARRAG